MKKRTKVAIFAIICSIAVVGSGFATWYFTSTGGREEIGGNINVVQTVYGSGRLVLADITGGGNKVLYDTNENPKNRADEDDLKLWLDQGSNKSSLTELIYFENGLNEGVVRTDKTVMTLRVTYTITADVNASATLAEKTEAVAEINSKNVTMAYEFELDEGLDTYITNVGTANSNLSLVAEESSLANTTSLTRVFVYDFTISFNYVSKPQTIDDYNTMKLATDGRSFTIGLTASVV